MKNDLLLRALAQAPCRRTPVWIMRQAGRYLPKYRALRKRHDFLTLCKTPELATEVTLLPLDIIKVDAAIIFSDILVVPDAMGMKLNMLDSIGPCFEHPIRTDAQIDKLIIPDVSEQLKYVTEAIKIVEKLLRERMPVIGFSGSPWTLASYMIEGKSSTSFKNAKLMMVSLPKKMHLLLDKISQVVIDYLKLQIEAGAEALQIFDTWASVLSTGFFKEFSLRYIQKIVHAVKETYPKVPIIVFAKGANTSLPEIAQCGCDAISLDWTVSLKKARHQVSDSIALQGNLDPVLLYAPSHKLVASVKDVLKDFGLHAENSGHIFNLGHGIFPDVPVENVQLLVETVKKESTLFHENYTESTVR